MARAQDPAVQALVDSGRVIKSRTVSFHVPSGTFGLWTGEGDFVEGGITYYGAGEGVLSGVAIQSTVGGIPAMLTLSLAFVAGGRFDPQNMISGIEAEDYQGRPMLLSDVYFDPDTMARVGSFRRVWTGVINTIRHKRKRSTLTIDVAGEQKTFYDMSMGVVAMRNDATQRARNPNDGFMRHATSVGRVAEMGRLPA